jgi:capsular polysaccharide biosynthesis protein
MKTYSVQIRAEITKNIEVQAMNEDDAYKEAHEIFSVASDEWPEKYSVDTLSILEITV